jgi:hypothetical protein
MVDQLARALLYEGYSLYPYRPSVKNRRRWTFGGIYPPHWSLAQDGTDPCVMQTQCLLESGPASALRINVRFLQLVDRTIGELVHPVDELPPAGEPEFRLLPRLSVGEKLYQPWQEAIEREVELGEIPVSQLRAGRLQKRFTFPHQRNIEPLRQPAGPIVAMLIRRQETIAGTVELSAAALEDHLLRITVRIGNRTHMADAESAARDEALMRSLVSTHTILLAGDARFISQTDPPARWRDHALKCANIGAWPVLVGAPGEGGTMLSSPIIVEDYPKIAPQSPGDLFDATEIDEILTLRIMTLTDEEKRLAAGLDDRVRHLLARTQALARDELMGLHGTLRDVGRGLKAGDRVRLRPLGRSDVMDIALDGKAATIVAIEQDFENRVHVAVTVDDDPGRDLGLRGQPGHRFFFGVDEVEPLDALAARKEAAL